ncbi:MAG: hypothetical protein Q9195_008135 [Heterodermia aff. obscurata]
MLPIVLALPYTNTSSCISQQWAIEGFSTFDAPPGPLQPGTPAFFNASSLSFRFEDPNSNTSTACIRRLAAGAGGTMADPHHHYPCDDGSVQYEYDGEILVVSHEFPCHGKTITASASINGAVHCVDKYGGSQCSTAITEIDVTPEVMG